MTLAYLFWHRPREPGAYEERLAAFHAALAADPPAGFLRSWTLRCDRAPCGPPGGAVYEDWYLVRDWAALGVLNAAAVDAARRPAHDAAASRAGDGAGGLYALLRGDPAPATRAVRWLSKPAGEPYGTFEASLPAAPEAQVWQRQMVLGPAPEYAVVGFDPGMLPARATRVTVAAVIGATDAHHGP